MKRRKSSQSSRQVEDPSPIRASFPRDLNGDRVPKTRPKHSASQDIPPGDPKTSEYAFFKKLKEDAGHRFRSQLPCHPDRNQSKKSTYLLRERTINLDNNLKAFKSSLVPKTVTPENSFSFLSPLGTAPNKSEQGGTEFHKVWGDVQTLQDNMDKCGQDTNADIFSRKRQKIRQWVVETSLPEIDKLCSKGCDFVAVLISRLFPVRNEENTGLVEFDTKSKSFLSPGSDNYFKEFHGMPVRNLMEVEFKLPLDVGLLSCGMEIPRERQLSNSSPPIHYSYRASHGYIMRELECSGDKKPPSCFIDDDYTSGFHTEKYESHLSSDFNGLDELYYPRKSFCRREPYPLLLGWDFENIMGARYSAVTDQDMQLSMYPISTDSQVDGEQLKHDSGLDGFLYPNKSLWGQSYPLLRGWDFNNIIKERYPSVTDPHMELSLCPISSCAQDDNQQSDSSPSGTGLCRSTLLSHHPITLHSLQRSPSPGYGSLNFGEHLLQDEDDIVNFLNSFSSPLPYFETDLNLSENSHHKIVRRGRSLPISFVSSSSCEQDSE